MKKKMIGIVAGCMAVGMNMPAAAVPALAGPAEAAQAAVADTVQTKNTYVSEYRSPETLFEEFMDTSKKTTMPVKYWAAQLLFLLKNDPKLKEFCWELAKIVKFKNAKRIACLFILYQDCFPDPMKKLIRSKDLKKVYKVIETRCLEGCPAAA